MTVFELTTTTTPASPCEPLTARERVVLAELVHGDTLEDVARRLFVTRNTVKSQVRTAYRKIGVSSRPAAIAWVRASGLR